MILIADHELKIITTSKAVCIRIEGFQGQFLNTTSNLAVTVDCLI